MAAHALTIHLTIEEGNLLLEALAECPFKSVFELIGKLNQQANISFGSNVAHGERRSFVFTESELSLTIKSLGNMPYHRVHQLLAELNRQLQTQVSNAQSTEIPSTHVDL